MRLSDPRACWVSSSDVLATKDGPMWASTGTTGRFLERTAALRATIQ